MTAPRPARWFGPLGAGDGPAGVATLCRELCRWVPPTGTGGVNGARGPDGTLGDAVMTGPRRAIGDPVQGPSRGPGPRRGRVGADSKDILYEARRCNGAAFGPWDGPNGGD